MTSQKETWQNLKTKYLREVDKALSSVQHPRSKDILADVESHLEQRFAELGPDQKNWENFQGIIADMGPPTDYVELLGPQAETPVTGVQRKYLVAVGIGVIVLVAVTWLLVSAKKVWVDDGSLTKTFPGTLNEGQKIYMEWTETYFASFLNRDKYARLSDSARQEMEQEWLKVLQGPWSREYYDAINCLAAIKSKKAVKPLLRIATERREKDNRDRWMAVRALGVVGDESVVPELIHLVYHYNQNTRFWGQISLVRLTGVNFGSD